jgi:hypothetical protein
MNENSQPARLRICLRAFAVWLIIIAAEIVHGILRAIVLVPWVGEFRSSQIGVFTGSAIILLIACMSIRWISAFCRTQLMLVGTIWLVLTVVFEVLFGRLVMDLPWERLLADYNMLEGGLMPLGLVVLLLSPWIASKMQSRSLTHGTELG